MAEWWENMPRAGAGSPPATAKDAAEWWASMPRADEAPSQIEGAARLPLMGASEFAKGVTKAVGGIGDLQTVIQTQVGKGIYDPVRNAVSAFANYVRGGEFAPTPRTQEVEKRLAEGRKGFATSDDLVALGEKAGAFNRPDLKPQGTGERYFAAGAEGAGMGAPLGLASVPAMAASLGGGTGSGVGAEIASDLTKGTKIAGHDVEPAARVIGSLVGGVAGGKAVDAGAKAVNALRGETGPALEAYKTAGVTPRSIGEAGGGHTAQKVEQFSANLPGGGPIQDARQKTLDEFSKSVEKTSSMLGTAATPMQAGEAIQNGARAWLGQWKAQTSQAWDDFWSLLPKTANVDIDATRQYLGQSGRQLKDIPGLSDALSSDQFKAIRAAIEAKSGPVSASSVKHFRSIVGSKLSDGPLAGNADTAELKLLYRALTDDIKTAASRVNPQALPAFNVANDITRTGHEISDTILPHLIGKERNAENAYQWALSQANQGGSRIADVGKVAPQAIEDVAGTRYAQMSRAQPRAQNELGTAVDPQQLKGQWANLSEEARTLLYGARGTPLRNRIEAQADIANRIDQTRRSVSAPRASEVSTVLSLMGGAAGAGVGSLTGNPSITAFGSLAGLAAPSAGNYLLARTLSNPALAKYSAVPGTGADVYRSAMIRALMEMQPR